MLAAGAEAVMTGEVVTVEAEVAGASRRESVVDTTAAEGVAKATPAAAEE